MILIYFLVAFLLGPLLYYNGRKNNLLWWKNFGLVAWVLGWGYLLNALYSLSRIAG